MIETIKKYSFLIAIVGIGILLFIVSRGKAPIPDFKLEKEALDARAEADKLKATIGHEAAVEAVEHKYEESLKKLDEDQKEQAKELRKDPAKLAQWIVRVGSK